jgi:hypothetical protein
MSAGIIIFIVASTVILGFVIYAASQNNCNVQEPFGLRYEIEKERVPGSPTLRNVAYLRRRR